MAGKQALLRTALAVCVPVAGFAIGRGLAPSSVAPEPQAAVAEPVLRRTNDLSSLLCEVSTGNLTRARARIAVLRDAPLKLEDLEELERLLVAIAIKDGASFDALIATFPDDLRASLVDRCAMALWNEPAAFVRLLADSEEFARIASGPRGEWALQAIQGEPGLFLDLLEQGQFAWPAKTMEWLMHGFQPDSAAASRLLELCRKGQLQVGNETTLAKMIQRLDEDGLAKLRSAPGDDSMSALLEQEAKARALFANFDPTGKSWGEISQRRMVTGMDLLITRFGVPAIEWGSVPRDLQAVLPGNMVRTAVRLQGDAGARTLLDSIKNSDLPADRRNEMLESAASTLFDLHGNIRLAIDFAHGISDDADGHNAGEDLLIKWMAFDPASAQDFTDKIEPSPYRDRILARVREISP